MKAHRVIAAIRWATALLGAVVVLDALFVAQISVGATATADFLSSITALTNIIAIPVFFLAGRSSWRSGERVGRRLASRSEAHARPFTVLRGVNAATLASMSVLFLVIYGPTVLGDPAQLTLNTVVLHLVIPSIALLDWLILPGPAPVDLRAVWLVLVFPVVWFGYTFARGALVSRYVYEFLDPTTPGSDRIIVSMTLFILSTFFLVGVLLFVVQRRITAAGGPLQ